MGYRRNLLEVDALEYGGLGLTNPQLKYIEEPRFTPLTVAA
jgi:hypothetical protein